MDRASTGKLGEKMTADFLRKNGYIVVKMNYHSRFGEIDIIAEDDHTIVFVEVKTREENAPVSPREAVDKNKQRRILLTAEIFLNNLHRNLQPRFDVAEVTVYKRKDLTDGYKLNYIKNAF